MVVNNIVAKMSFVFVMEISCSVLGEKINSKHCTVIFVQCTPHALTSVARNWENR